MGRELDKLIADWRSSDLAQAPYLFFRDVAVYEEYGAEHFCHYRTLREYIETRLLYFGVCGPNVIPLALSYALG